MDGLLVVPLIILGALALARLFIKLAWGIDIIGGKNDPKA